MGRVVRHATGGPPRDEEERRTRQAFSAQTWSFSLPPATRIGTAAHPVDNTEEFRGLSRALDCHQDDAYPTVASVAVRDAGSLLSAVFYAGRRLPNLAALDLQGTPLVRAGPTVYGGLQHGGLRALTDLSLTDIDFGDAPTEEEVLLVTGICCLPGLRRLRLAGRRRWTINGKRKKHPQGIDDVCLFGCGHCGTFTHAL